MTAADKLSRQLAAERNRALQAALKALRSELYRARTTNWSKLRDYTPQKHRVEAVEYCMEVVEELLPPKLRGATRTGRPRND